MIYREAAIAGIIFHRVIVWSGTVASWMNLSSI